MEHAHVKFIVAPIAFLFLVPDLALTAAFDTILFPIEYFVESDQPRLSVSDECEYSKRDLSAES